MTTPVDYASVFAASFSGLKNLSRSPAYAKWRRENPGEPTDAMIRGKAFHCLVLEPDSFASRFVLKDWDARTAAGKARKAEVEATGATPLNVETWDAAHRSADAVLLDPAARPLLDSAKVRESPVYWKSDGLDCKGVPDARGSRIVIDLKSTNKANPSLFPRFIADSRVDAQLGWYAWGASHPEPTDDVEKFVIAVTDDQPHEVYVYEFDDAIIARGWEWLNPLADLWRECVKTGAWRGGPGGILPARLAPWDRQKESEAVDEENIRVQ